MLLYVSVVRIFKCERYATEWMYNLSIHQLTGIWIVSSILATVNKAPMSIQVLIFCDHMF